jgi:uncharacterized protein with beta-barrel porin domain
LEGNNLTVGNSYTDNADSTVDLTGMATFMNGATIHATGNGTTPGFKSDGITIFSGLLELANGATVDTGSGYRDIGDPGSTLRIGDGAKLSGRGDTAASNLELHGSAHLEGNDLTVGNSYTDNADSTVDLTGLATFMNGATINATGNGTDPGFKSEGVTVLSGLLELVSNAKVDTGAGARLINGILRIGDQASLSGSGDTTVDDLELHGKASLEGNNLTVNNSYFDNADSKVKLDGTASFISDATITSTDFIAGSLAIASGKTLALAGADVRLTGQAPIILEGGIVINNSTFHAPAEGADISFRGGYESFQSDVTLGGKAIFNSNGNNSITEGSFSAKGMDIAGTGTTVTVNAVDKDKFNLKGGDLSIASGGNTLNAGGHALNLNNVTLEAGSTLYGGDLTVGGVYTQAASSAVDLDGKATFKGADGTVHTISGDFKAKGMAVGDDENENNPHGITVDVTASAPGALDFKGGDLIITSNSQLRKTGDLNLTTAGAVKIDLNRDMNTAALSATGEMTLNDNALTLHHTGTTSQNGTWTLAHADNGIVGEFAKDVNTVKLKGTVRYGPDDVYFDGRYNAQTPGPWPYEAALPPNARRAAPGMRNMIDLEPNAVAAALAELTEEQLEAAMKRNLQGMTAEASVNHAAQTQRAHIELANTALGLALGAGAPLSSQGFVPNLQASLSQMGQQANPFQAQQQRRGIMAARQRVSPAGQDGIPMQKHYSVLAGWQPASHNARQIVAQAAPNTPIAGMAGGSSGIPGVNFWGGYVNTAEYQQKKDGYSGYNAHQSGVLAGVSVDAAPELTLGLYGGWTAGQYSAQGVKADIDSNSVHVGGFFRFKDQRDPQGGVNVTGDLAYSSTSNESSRSFYLEPPIGSNQKMEASYNQHVISGGLEVAYDYVPSGDEYSRVTPFIAGRYSHLSQESYTEDGALALRVGSIENDQFASTVGVRVARDFVTGDEDIIITPRVSAAWQRNWTDQRFTARSNFVGSPVSFNTKAVPQDHDAAQLGAGLDLRFRQDSGWDFGIKAAYSTELRASSTGHNVFGGFEVNF